MKDVSFLYKHVKELNISEDLFCKLIENKVYSVNSLTTKTVSQLLNFGITINQVKYLKKLLKEHDFDIKNDCVFDDDKNQNQDEFNL